MCGLNVHGATPLGGIPLACGVTFVGDCVPAVSAPE